MTPIFRLTATTKKGNVKVWDTMDLDVAHTKFHKLVAKHGLNNVKVTPINY